MMGLFWGLMVALDFYLGYVAASIVWRTGNEMLAILVALMFLKEATRDFRRVIGEPA